MFRKVKQLLPVFNLNMGGIIVQQALPTQQVNQVDPFLLLHHGEFKFNPLSAAKHQGIGPHPHRGFSPVTFVIEGAVHHQDSRGNNQVAKKGEVQWMHAGAGIIHSERPAADLVEQKGKQEIVQLWINSPKVSKMKAPSYQFIQESHIPIIVQSTFNNKLIAGNYNNKVSKINTESEMLILWSHAANNGKQTIHVPTYFNCCLYVIKGELNLTGFGKIEKKTLVIFENDYENIEMHNSAEVQFLLLAGKPINEPIAQQGPFVMNTQTEILEAMRDYQMGKMGFLVEE